MILGQQNLPVGTPVVIAKTSTRGAVIFTEPTGCYVRVAAGDHPYVGYGEIELAHTTEHSTELAPWTESDSAQLARHEGRCVWVYVALDVFLGVLTQGATRHKSAVTVRCMKGLPAGAALVKNGCWLDHERGWVHLLVAHPSFGIPAPGEDWPDFEVEYRQEWEVWEETKI